MDSIRNETANNVSLITDLDNFRTRYRQYDKDLNLSITYPSYEILAFDRNLFILLSGCIRVNFKPRWYMKPDYVSYDYYNTVIYWPLILFINNISSIENFRNIDNILIPNLSDILQVSRDRFTLQDLEDMNNNTTVNNVVKYYKSYPMDKDELSRTAAKEELNPPTETPTPSPSLIEITENFTLSSTDISNQYVSLSHTPYVENSIELKINNYYTAQIYGYDYVLRVNSSNIKRIISWHDEYCTLGDGMANLLSTGDILHIKYTYEGEI